MILLYVVTSVSAYFVIAVMVSLSLGILGGMVYFCMSAALSETPYMGRIMAVGASSAILLQYLMQEYLGLIWGMPVILILGFALTVWLTVKKPWEWLKEEKFATAEIPADYRNNPGKWMVLLLLTVIVLETVGIYFDTNAVRPNIQLGSEQYTWARLFLIVGYLLIGGGAGPAVFSEVLFDEYLPVLCLCRCVGCLL